MYNKKKRKRTKEDQSNHRRESGGRERDWKGKERGGLPRESERERAFPFFFFFLRMTEKTDEDQGHQEREWGKRETAKGRPTERYIEKMNPPPHLPCQTNNYNKKRTRRSWYREVLRG